MLDNPETLAAQFKRDGYIFPNPAMSAAQAAAYRAKLEAVERAVKDDLARRKTLRRYSNIVLDFVDEITRLPSIGLAIRYIATRMKTAGGAPMSATLVRGQDHHGNFTLTEPPGGVLTDHDLARYEGIAGQRNAAMFRGAKQP